MPHPPPHGLSAHQLAIIADVLRPYADRIDKVCLFGSRAVGEARPMSDIDLVIYGALSQAEIDRIWTLFEDSSLSVTVDVTTYDLIAYPPLRHHVDKVAATLLTREDLLGKRKAEV